MTDLSNPATNASATFAAGPPKPASLPDRDINIDGLWQIAGQWPSLPRDAPLRVFAGEIIRGYGLEFLRAWALARWQRWVCGPIARMRSS
jgi:hypothetical protein